MLRYSFLLPKIAYLHVVSALKERYKKIKKQNTEEIGQCVANVVVLGEPSMAAIIQQWAREYGAGILGDAHA